MQCTPYDSKDHVVYDVHCTSYCYYYFIMSYLLYFFIGIVAHLNTLVQTATWSTAVRYSLPWFLQWAQVVWDYWCTLCHKTSRQPSHHGNSSLEQVDSSILSLSILLLPNYEHTYHQKQQATVIYFIEFNQFLIPDSRMQQSQKIKQKMNTCLLSF